MPSPSSGKSNESIIPIGMVLLAVGFVIVVTALLIWQMAPQTVPRALQKASVPPTPVQATVLTPTPAQEDVVGEMPVLLPETPLESGRLPSIASVAEAPSQAIQQVATQPRRLVIPSLAIDVDVRRVGLVAYDNGAQRYYQWDVPRGFEVGWHDTTAPLGFPGNTVLNGHNNIYGEVFKNLIELGVGEQIILYDAERAYSYEVTQQELFPENDQPLSVRTENARWIQTTDDERITLVSCWPYATNDYRLVVVAKPISQIGS